VTWAAGPAGAAVANGAYEHVWQAESMFSGAAGESSSRVLSSAVSLEERDGTYSGTLRYRDLLGVVTSGVVTSQESLLELVLTGTALEAGTAAGGTFDGTATLTWREVPDLAAALADSVLEEEGDRAAVLHVSGHWGATKIGRASCRERV